MCLPGQPPAAPAPRRPRARAAGTVRRVRAAARRAGQCC